MNLVIKVDAKKLQKNIDRTLKKKIPLATKNALNRTGYSTINDLKRTMPNYLDRPTPFTQRSLRLHRAKNTATTATIFVAPIQEKYLTFQVNGGIGTREKVTPATTYRTNAYGNLPRNATKGKNIYVGKLRDGRRAYYKAAGGKKSRRLDLVGFITRNRQYSKRWPYYRLGKTYVNKHYLNKFRSEYNKLVT